MMKKVDVIINFVAQIKSKKKDKEKIEKKV
jgi:hypothetical protein